MSLENLSKEEIGFVIHEMVIEIGTKTELRIKNILTILSEYYNINTKDIMICLREYNSPFGYYRIEAIIDGKLVKRTTFLNKFGKILRKIAKNIDIDNDNQINLVINVLESNYSNYSYIE